ncbi:hypothetical protein ACFXTH_001114 [Malus domestica]
MDEQKDMDVALGSGSESTVSVSGHVAGETLAGAVACVSEGQVEGSFGEDVGDDEGGDCEGDDIMVEVLGSNVYVGGVCTNGDGGDEGVGRDESVEVDMGSEGNVRSSGGDGGKVGELDSVAADISSTVIETQVVHFEEAEMVVRQDVDSEEVNVSDEKAQDATAENGLGGSLIEPVGSETQVVISEVVRESVEVSAGGLVEVVEHEKKLVVGEVDALNDLKAQKAGVSDDEVWNPGIEKATVTVNEEGNPKPSSEQSQVSAGGGDVAGVDNVDILTSKVAGKETGKTNENSSNPVEEQLVKIEPVGGSTHSGSNVPENSVSSPMPPQVVLGSDTGATGAQDSEKSQFLKPEESVEDMVHDIALVSTTLSLPAQVIPGGVVSVTDGRGLLNSEKELHLKPEESIGKNTFHDTVLVESNTEQEMEKDSHGNGAEQVGVDGADQSLESEKCLEKSATAYVAPIHPDMEAEEVNEQVSDAEGVLNGGEQIEDERDITPMDTEEVLDSVTAAETNVVHEVGVKEQFTDAVLDGLHGGQYMEGEKEATDAEQPKVGEEDILKQEAIEGSSEIVPQPRYELPPENHVFSASDLVWGKVKSHPWWPGQIFDYTVASEKAMKYHKKDCFLVAYFGDRTFAWNEPSSLRPFRSYFSQSEKQGNSEALQNAVNCALEEVSRRVGLGLACSCIPKEVYEKIRFQKVENAGICQESSRRDEVDESASASSLECNKLLEYIKALARFPSGNSDRLEVVIAKAHMLAFYRLKGYYNLPEFQSCGDILENKDERIEHTTPNGKDVKGTFSGPDIITYSHKRKHNLRGGVYSKVKERSLSELMDGGLDSLDGGDWLDGNETDGLVSPSSGKRRKGFEYHVDDDGRKVTVAKVSNTTPAPKQSFKIGECIQRVASQLTGSPIVKSNSDRPAGDGSDVAFQSSGDVHRGKTIDGTEYSSLDELLSQLQSAAEDPRKDYHSLKTVVNFFCDFRNSVAVGQLPGMEHVAVDKVGGRKRKSNSAFGLPETFEFDDMNDTYWTDRVIQNGAEEQTPRRGRKVNYQPVVLAQPEKSPQEGRRPYTRKRYSQTVNALPPERPVGYVDENAPTELVMNFTEVNSVPSEIKLNRMFRRFGPLKEAETEVDRESSRARVVFKKCSDAEVAIDSAGKFKIFGSIPVNYQLNYTPSQLNYTPSIQFSISPSATTHDQEMQLVLSSHDHEMHLDLSAHDQMQLDLSTHDHMQLDMQLDLSSHDQMHLDLSTFDNL